MLSVSVIIPTWCEARDITAAVRVAFEIGDEVIVADAGSPDETAALAAQAGARVVHAPKGRGPQLDAGARAARGDVLLFLHADARLPPAAHEAIQQALASSEIAGGSFRLRFEPATKAARFFSWAYHVRHKLFDVYYGDAALFVRRSTYPSLGGFRPLPILEDYEFIRRLERSYSTAYITDVSVWASARRFERTPVRTLLIWLTIQASYSLGVSAHVLSHFYADVRHPRAGLV